RAAARAPPNARRRGPTDRVRAWTHGAGNRCRVHRALSRHHDACVALRGRASDAKRRLAAARRPGPGRPRRQTGRNAAKPLDEAEHGGIPPARRRPVMIAADADLDALFKRLHLANARRMWRTLVERAERETWSYHDFLTLLATEEIAHRQQTRL